MIVNVFNYSWVWQLKTITNFNDQMYEKKCCKEFFYPWGKVKKWLFLMKLIAFFLFAGLCQVSATAFGQRETVTFSRDAMTLEEIFTTSENNYSMIFFIVTRNWILIKKFSCLLEK